jgi:alpha-ketoglutarate-dependent taurine dioxygenase
MLKIEPLSPAIGVEIAGVDLARPLDVYEHKWTPGDVVLRDNRSCLNAAPISTRTSAGTFGASP